MFWKADSLFGIAKNAERQSPNHVVSYIDVVGLERSMTFSVHLLGMGYTDHLFRVQICLSIFKFKIF